MDVPSHRENAAPLLLNEMMEQLTSMSADCCRCIAPPSGASFLEIVQRYNTDGSVSLMLMAPPRSSQRFPQTAEYSSLNS